MIDQPKNILDVRLLTKTEEVPAFRDGGLFPVLATVPDGSAVAILRGGAGHVGLSGRIELIRSYDGGLNWSQPNVLANSEWDDRNPAFGVSENGTLILAYQSIGAYDEEGNYHDPAHEGNNPNSPVEIRIMRSFDSGFNWESPVPFNLECLRSGTAYGKIVQMKDGTLLMAVYGYPVTEIMGEEQVSSLKPTTNCSYLVRSRDDGLTWESPSLIGVGMNETGLLVTPDGQILAIMRSAAENALFSTRSGDGGFTWTEAEQITNAAQHPADLMLLGNGSILLTYGNRRPEAYRIEGRISQDGGKTWLDTLLVFSGKLNGYDTKDTYWPEFGYPTSTLCPAVHRGAGITLYYVNPAFPKTTDWSLKGCPQAYSPYGYKAIAVLWDEDDLLRAFRKIR